MGIRRFDGTELELPLPVIAFDVPARLPPIPSWNGLIPVAFWIVDALRPEVLVELGTYMGNSYLAFCQAVVRLGLATRCFAIDNWKGDQHAGFYDESVYDELRAYHDPLYGKFSRLVRSSFDGAVAQFGDGTIDLLHIDGMHSYASVKHDFETWLPKLSMRSVVLFHDIDVRERDFGVWRFWEEIGQTYPSFAFLHSHGLGILAVGKNRAGAIRWLTEEASQSSTLIAETRAIFSRLGDAVQCTRLREELGTLQDQLRQGTQRLLEENARNAALELVAAELRRQHDEERSLARSAIERSENQQQVLMEGNAKAFALVASHCRELEALRNSTSWRITGPLRLGATALRATVASALRVAGSRRPFAVSRRSQQRTRASEPAPDPVAAQLAIERPQSVSTIRASADIAVILHLHYAELFKEISAYIRNIPEPYHLYVSVTERKTFEGVAHDVISHHQESEIRLVDNRGRDILPMLDLLPKIVGKYSYACKIHTKKSVHSEVGEVWRKDLLSQLLGSRDRVEEFLACFRCFPDLGLIGPDGHRLTDAQWWRKERARVMGLASRMAVPQEHLGLDFFAGSMFWFRPAALKPLADLGLTGSDFEPESGQIEGTMANALERCFSMCAKTAGYRVTDSAEAVVAARGLVVSSQVLAPAGPASQERAV